MAALYLLTADFRLWHTVKHCTEKAVIDLTVHYHEIYKGLQSLGYYGSPERLFLRDEEDEE